MKTQTNLSMSDRMNFYQAVVNYINDNLSFIKEIADSTDAEELAKVSLEHYNMSVEASCQDDEVLSDEQKEEFFATAKRLFTQGFVEHAGSLIN